MFRHTLLGALGLAAASIATLSASAANFSFTGSFNWDDDVQFFSFFVAQQSPVSFRSWSYAGGTNAAGNLIPRGGFDPLIAVFNSAGLLVDQNDDGIDIDPNADQEPDLNGQAWDVLFTLDLSPGIYTGALAQFPNFAAGPTLADGFLKQGEGDYSADYPCAAQQSSFQDSFISDYCGRTNDWAFDVIDVEAAALGALQVPEPENLALLGLGAMALALRRRRAA
jgi:hypothetical protein